MQILSSLPVVPDAKLPLLSDVVFRRLFEDVALLRELLNALLRLHGTDSIVSVTLPNVQIKGRLATNKEGVLDLHARCADGRTVTVEIQLASRSAYLARAIHYLAGACHGQLRRGDSYGKLRPVIAVHILGFCLLDDTAVGDTFHSLFELRERETRHRLTDLLSIHLIEMPRFLAADRCSTSEEKWLHFLQRGHLMTKEEIAALSIPAIQTAEERLAEISADWSLRTEYLLRERAERDRISNIIDARDEALKEGHEAGHKAGHEAGLKAGHEVGHKLGEKLGLERGERLGFDKGQVLTQRNTLLRLVVARGLILSAAQRDRVLACEDLDQLTAWFDRAVVCSHGDDLF